MLVKVGFGLLVVWSLGALGLFEAGDAVHILLLTGLMLLLLGFLRARDAAAAVAREVRKTTDR